MAPLSSEIQNKFLFFAKTTKVELKKILNDHYDTRSILSITEQTNKFDKSHAGKITDRIVEHLIDKNGTA